MRSRFVVLLHCGVLQPKVYKTSWKEVVTTGTIVNKYQNSYEKGIKIQPGIRLET